MAPAFIRSASLPLSPSHKKASYHVRSVSLPCRSHPLISNLEAQIRVIQSWATNPKGSSAWIEAGLAHIEQLQVALEDFLQLSTTQEIICQAVSVDQLLEDLLQLVDAYGSFVSTILSLKESHSNIQSACRRGDDDGVVSALKSQRKVEKEIAQLASGLRSICKCRHLYLSSNAKEIEPAGIIMEAISSTVIASMAVFSGLGSLSAAASSKKSFGTMRSLKNNLANSSSLIKRATGKQVDINTFERSEDINECLTISECFSERVYRSLINSRVSLLNIMTPCL